MTKPRCEECNCSLEKRFNTINGETRMTPYWVCVNIKCEDYQMPKEIKGKEGTQELKPCPFCGGEAKIERKGTRGQSMIISCVDCGCTLESGDVFGLTNILKWNKRID